jgi:pyrroline-5-carboxylate reductase
VSVPTSLPSSLKDKAVGFLGAGNMGEAIIKGLLQTGLVPPSSIAATDARADRLQQMASQYGIRGLASNRELVAGSDVVILAVKPQIMGAVLREVAPAVDRGRLLISVAAGVPVAALREALGKPARLIRVMPNTPALVLEGVTAIARADGLEAGDLELAQELFGAVGRAVVLDEDALDAVTGLSGSGPAYIFLILEALADAGVKVGLSRRTAQLLAAQTVLGSAKLLLETNEHPGKLKDMVTSPGGTAITGLHTLEHGGVRTTLIDAVEAATRRSHELGLALLKTVD